MGDEEAKSILMKANLRLVDTFAKKICRKEPKPHTFRLNTRRKSWII